MRRRGGLDRYLLQRNKAERRRACMAAVRCGDKPRNSTAGKEFWEPAVPSGRFVTSSATFSRQLIKASDRMSLVANTAPHLPYLRRFARALTGGQKSGDAYVVSVLEALVADPNSFDTENDPRVELFKAFCRTWNSLDVNLAKDELRAGGARRPVAPARGADAAAAAGLSAHGGRGFHRSRDRRHPRQVGSGGRQARSIRPAARSPSRWRPTCSSSRTSR